MNIFTKTRARRFLRSCYDLLKNEDSTEDQVLDEFLDEGLLQAQIDQIGNYTLNHVQKQEHRETISLYGRDPKEIEKASLQLAYLKENFKYQEAFKKFKGFFQDRNTPRENGQENPCSFFEFVRCLSSLYRFGISPKSVGLLYLATDHDLLKLLDPACELDTPDKYVRACLSVMFEPVGITQIYPPFTDQEHVVGCESQAIQDIEDLKLKPFERLLKVDLRVKSSQLSKQFNGFLRITSVHHKVVRKVGWIKAFKSLRQWVSREAFESHSHWNIDNSREREEAWQQLKIWKLKKNHKSFTEIAKELNITPDTAKHAFYKAYERSQNKKHDPDIIREKFSKVRKETFDGICASCPNKGNYPDCIETCPDALQYIDQDQVKLNWRETPLSELNTTLEDDVFFDRLQYKNTIR